ncbi:MAG: hypothetical protein JRF72_13385, partial [Deltaproteobacteria bacterium]|nr:hypothetical protein [Deltaproteobacteria bacterium]
MLKKFLLILALSGIHFALGVIVIPITIARLLPTVASDQAAKSAVQLFIWTTRVLYFPIISLSLYSRRWFPGDLIYIPITINSILWGITLF